MNDKSKNKPKGTEPYWYESPKVLFSAPSASNYAELDTTLVPTVGERFKNAFIPEPSLGRGHPANFNRLTRLSIIVAIILAIVFRSWWPVAIAAGLMLLIMLIAYGLQVQRTREERARRAREYEFDGVNRNPGYSSRSTDSDDEPYNEKTPFVRSDALSSSMQELPQSSFVTPTGSIFLPPNFPPTASDDPNSSLYGSNVDWGTSSYVPNVNNPRCNRPLDRNLAARAEATGCDGYPACGPGGPVACGPGGPDACSVDCERRDPRADIPNPSKHNTYEKVDARYEIYETKPQPVMASDPLAPNQITQQRPKSAPPVVVGMDPKSANVGLLTSNYQRPQNLSASYMSNMGVGVPLVREIDGETQPQTQTEQMLTKMYMDKNQYGWDEMVAKRAPDWRVNPNDPRNRKALEEKEIQRQSFRGLSWGMGP